MMLTLGCDPEFFLRDRVTKDFVSAFGLFPGTKDKPFKLDKGAVQVDGMALEFNIHPASTMEEFTTNIETTLGQIKEMVDSVGMDLEMAFEPVADFDPEYFAIQPLTPKILGCDPDFDEDGNMKTPPEGAQDRPMRTAAGHVHIGFRRTADPFEFEHFENCKKVARAFKNVPGYYPKTPQERRRTQLYGVGGSFRPKPYGIELRSPSNKWVETKQGREDMFKITYKTMMDLGNKDAV